MSKRPTRHLTPRQRAREIAFQFLFRLDAKQDPSAEMTDFDQHAKHFQCPEESHEFAERLVKTTMESLSMIDEMISKHAKNWRLDRMSATDKSLLRIGICELLFFKDVPASVTLNEVIELSKDFGESESPAFLNGILDPVSKEPLALAGKVPSDAS